MDPGREEDGFKTCWDLPEEPQQQWSFWRHQEQRNTLWKEGRWSKTDKWRWILSKQTKRRTDGFLHSDRKRSCLGVQLSHHIQEVQEVQGSDTASHCWGLGYFCTSPPLWYELVIFLINQTVVCSVKCQKIRKSLCFQKPKMTILKCLVLSELKIIQFTVTEVEMNQKIFTFKRMESENVYFLRYMFWCWVCLLNCKHVEMWRVGDLLQLKTYIMGVVSRLDIMSILFLLSDHTANLVSHWAISITLHTSISLIFAMNLLASVSSSSLRTFFFPSKNWTSNFKKRRTLSLTLFFFFFFVVYFVFYFIHFPESQ